MQKRDYYSFLVRTFHRQLQGGTPSKDESRLEEGLFASAVDAAFEASSAGRVELEGKKLGHLNQGAVQREERASVMSGDHADGDIRDGGLKALARQMKAGPGDLIPKTARDFQPWQAGQAIFQHPVLRLALRPGKKLDPDNVEKANPVMLRQFYEPLRLRRAT